MASGNTSALAATVACATAIQSDLPGLLRPLDDHSAKPGYATLLIFRQVPATLSRRGDVGSTSVGMSLPLPCSCSPGTVPSLTRDYTAAPAGVGWSTMRLASGQGGQVRRPDYPRQHQHKRTPQG